MNALMINRNWDLPNKPFGEVTRDNPSVRRLRAQNRRPTFS